jgi:hypothetical protein
MIMIELLRKNIVGCLSFIVSEAHDGHLTFKDGVVYQSTIEY